MNHAIIIPARDEEETIARTLASLLEQTLPPTRIVVVNDGSSDGTAAIVEKYGSRHPILRLITRQDRGRRLPGSGVVGAFHAGYAAICSEPFEYVSKFDADLVFPPDYCERVLGQLETDRQLGAAGGTLCDLVAGSKVPLRCPDHHVVGPLKTYRRAAFDQIGGYHPTHGFDVLDLVDLRRHGWKTQRIRDLEVLHLRPHGSATAGSWTGRFNWGRDDWTMRSHPLFVFFRGAYRMLDRPYLIGGLSLWAGYLTAAIVGERRIERGETVSCLRREQSYRIFHGNRLPRR